MSSFDDPLTDRAFRLRIMAVDPRLLQLFFSAASIDLSSGWDAAAADLTLVDIEQYLYSEL